ncbi:MAG: EAL domain-containing protein [Hyphomicrobiaceae bacterium]
MSKRLHKQVGRNSPRRGAEILVFAAIVLITAAVWFGLVLHAGLTAAFSTSAAFATFVGLFMVHKLFRRSQQAADMQAEIERLQTELKSAGRKNNDVEFETGPSLATATPSVRAASAGASPPTPEISQQDVENERLDEERRVMMNRRMDGILGRRVRPDVEPPLPSMPTLSTEITPETDLSLSPPATPSIVAETSPTEQQIQPQMLGATGLDPALEMGAVSAPLETASLANTDVIPTQTLAETGALAENGRSSSQQALDATAAAGAVATDTVSPMPTPDTLPPPSPSDAPTWQSHENNEKLRPYLPNLSHDGPGAAAAGFDAHFSSSEAPSAMSATVLGSEPSNIREVDVKKVHGLIKKLAEQVNAVEALSLGRKNKPIQDNAPSSLADLHDAKVSSSMSSASNAGGDLADAGSTAAPFNASPVLPQAEAAGVSVSALNTTAQTMRTFEAPLDLADPSIDVARDESFSRNVVVEVSEAIASGRINILLSPIHGLRERKAQHYEISIALHDAAGGPIEISDQHEALRGTSLLPALDSARLVRTAKIGEQLVARGYNGALFSKVTGEALDADQFLTAFADTYQAREAFSTQLVIVFQQSDVRRFGEQAWATLYDMQHLGFRFALAGVTDLDMDFVQLKSAGFEFVKLTTKAFIDGLPALGRQIRSSDVCQHLGQAGLTLVVDGIASEEDLAKIFGFGVLFGQGELFGGARPVRSKSATASSSGEAAA